MNGQNYMQAGNAANPPRCECHECTQARWKTSLQGQITGAIGGGQALQELKQQQVAKLGGQQVY